MVIFERDIAVDMGTSTTLLFEQGKGVVAREPTVVAIDRVNSKISKVGQDAQKMLGRTPANIVAIHPVSAALKKHALRDLIYGCAFALVFAFSPTLAYFALVKKTLNQYLGF